ncbi:MAG: helix-turn-helix domain-containing protein [Erysipelotrichaceae bacterium]
MLSENIKSLRKAKGLSQEELAVKLNVVRQTVSKWETGLSVPDCDMLIKLSEELDTSVSILLGENVEEKERSELEVIAQKLETINMQLYRQKEQKRKIIRGLFALIILICLIILIVLFFLNSSYLGWDFNNPELAAAGTVLHGFEWIFVRVCPFVFILSAIGLFCFRKRDV